jgi:hypothetical protein
VFALTCTALLVILRSITVEYLISSRFDYHLILLLLFKSTGLIIVLQSCLFSCELICGEMYYTFDLDVRQTLVP